MVAEICGPLEREGTHGPTVLGTTLESGRMDGLGETLTGPRARFWRGKGFLVWIFWDIPEYSWTTK